MAKLGWGISLLLPVTAIVVGFVLLLGGGIMLPREIGAWAGLIGTACIVAGVTGGTIPFTVLAMLKAQQEGLELQRKILMAVINMQPNQAAARIETRIGGITL